MDLQSVYGGSFVNWETVAGSWAKRTVASRLMLLGARRYLDAADTRPSPERAALVSSARMPDEVKRAFASVPEPEDPAAAAWGSFVDAALAAELEMISYGERPPVLHELRNGLEAAASEAGTGTPLGRWFLDRRAALPGADLPEDPEYLPV